MESNWGCLHIRMKVDRFSLMTLYPLSPFLSFRCSCFVRTDFSGMFSTSISSFTCRIFPAISGECQYTVCIRRCNPSDFNIRCFRSPNAIAERRRVILKCVVDCVVGVASDGSNTSDLEVLVLNVRYGKTRESVWDTKQALPRHTNMAVTT